MRSPWKQVAPLALLTMTVFSSIAKADAAYITGGNTIYKWDTATNTVAPVVTAVSSLDSLVFDASGNSLIYSVIGTNQIGMFNLTTLSNSIIANVGAGAADMTLEPGGNTVLVSDAFTTTISRVDLTTHAVTTFNVGTRPDGLAYDNAGHLFAVLGLNEVAELDPTTMAVIKTISTPSAPDGLTFDSTTGMLYVGSDGGGFYTVDTNLTSATFTNIGAVVDGVAANGNLLYLVVRGTDALQYNLTTNTITETSPGIGGADDIAPLSGLGSQAVPEPGSFAAIGMLGFGLLAGLRRRFAR
jgi:sugar lactone lactonase YvrE